MKSNINFLPFRLARKDKSIVPTSWSKVISNYSQYRRKAIREVPSGYNTLLAGLLVSLAKHDKQVIDKVISLTRNNITEHVFLSLVGSALCNLDYKDEGLDMLRKAVELHPSDSYILALAAETNDLDEKISISEKVLSDNPNDCDALRHLAFAMYFKGETEEAESIIDKILQIAPANIYALKFKGNIFFDKEKYNEAIDEYSKIQLKPTPVSLSLKIFHCYYLQGNMRKAKKIAKKLQGKIDLAYDIDPKNRPAIKLIEKVLES